MVWGGGEDLLYERKEKTKRVKITFLEDFEGRLSEVCLFFNLQIRCPKAQLFYISVHISLKVQHIEF